MKETDTHKNWKDVKDSMNDPMENDDIKVRLIGQPLSVYDPICIANCTMLYADPMKAVGDMRPEDKQDMVQEILKSRLRTPLEFVSFQFLATGVSRGLTHQIVRHRLWSFAQQSLRFFDASYSNFAVPYKIKEAGIGDLYSEYCKEAVTRYKFLVSKGIPVEDARGLLPHSTQTMISFSANLRALIDFFEVRLCLQAQLEHRQFAVKVKQAIASVYPDIAEHLVRVCDRTNKCVFRSQFDRPCPLHKEEGGDVE